MLVIQTADVSDVLRRPTVRAAGFVGPGNGASIEWSAHLTTEIDVDDNAVHLVGAR